MSINWHNFCISMRFMHLKMLSCLFYAFVANFTLIFYQIWPFKISQISCDISYQIPKYRVISCGSQKKYRSGVLSKMPTFSVGAFGFLHRSVYWEFFVCALCLTFQVYCWTEEGGEIYVAKMTLLRLALFQVSCKVWLWDALCNIIARW